MSIPKTFTLSNGVSMPRLGLGTHKAQGQAVVDAVRWAVQAGYKHIDTASIYKNEAEIAQALQEEGVHGTGEVFITTKISPYDHGFEKSRQALEASLERLKLPCVDCVLVHWPGVPRKKADNEINKQMRAATWQALEACYEEGLCRAIGVSNYNAYHLEDLMTYAKIPPCVNQVEMHPQLVQGELRAACERLNIAVVAYSPLGTGELVQHPEVAAIAASLARTPAQVLVRWGLQHGVISIPKSVQEQHIRDNAAVLEFALSEEQMQRLDALDEGKHFCWDAAAVV